MLTVLLGVGVLTTPIHANAACYDVCGCGQCITECDGDGCYPDGAGGSICDCPTGCATCEAPISSSRVMALFNANASQPMSRAAWSCSPTEHESPEAI